MNDDVKKLFDAQHGGVMRWVGREPEVLREWDVQRELQLRIPRWGARRNRS